VSAILACLHQDAKNLRRRQRIEATQGSAEEQIPALDKIQGRRPENVFKVTMQSGELSIVFVVKPRESTPQSPKTLKRCTANALG
jgi:hypothetical protein